jgi:hypothetical protein
MKNLKCNLVKYLLILGLMMPVMSCKEDDPIDPPKKRTAKEITAFSISTLALTGEIDPVAYSITLTVSPDFDLSQLESVVPRIEYKGEKIEPTAMAPQNFTRDVTYKVTAEDGLSQDYTVKLKISEFNDKGFAKVTQVWAKDGGLYGFTATSGEPSLALLGDKLVISRSALLINAATGEPTGEKLDTTGTGGKFHPTNPANNYPFSVTNDDAGNVIGIPLGAWTSGNIAVYKWTSSLTSAPELVCEMTGFPQFGRKLSVVGDINGSGYIAQFNHRQGQSVAGDRTTGDVKQYVWQVTGGQVDISQYEVIETTPPDKQFYQTLIPMTTTSIYPYYLAVTGTGELNVPPPSEVSYKVDESAEKEIINDSKWSRYVYHAKKFDFNGVTCLAILSTDSDGKFYLSILDTGNNTITYSVEIQLSAAISNGATSVTNSLEETLPTGEKTIRLYTFVSGNGVWCHELTNKP